MFGDFVSMLSGQMGKLTDMFVVVTILSEAMISGNFVLSLVGSILMNAIITHKRN